MGYHCHDEVQMKTTRDDLPSCRFCKKTIQASEKLVYTAGGPMHAACQIQLRGVVEDRLATDIAAGRHSTIKDWERQAELNREARAS